MIFFKGNVKKFEIIFELIVQKIMHGSYHIELSLNAAILISGFGFCSFSIRGFDYLRMQQPQLGRDNCYF
jgi:hypothetical protein